MVLMMLGRDERSQLSQLFQNLRSVQTEAFSQDDITNLANRYLWCSSHRTSFPWFTLQLISIINAWLMLSVFQRECMIHIVQSEMIVFLFINECFLLECKLLSQRSCGLQQRFSTVCRMTKSVKITLLLLILYLNNLTWIYMNSNTWNQSMFIVLFQVRKV